MYFSVGREYLPRVGFLILEVQMDYIIRNTNIHRKQLSVIPFIRGIQRIVLSSDVDGRIAKYCDGTVIMYEESEFGELSAENYVDELENNKCNVLGVVING